MRPARHVPSTPTSSAKPQRAQKRAMLRLEA
jgi:hypothetical protein